MLSRNDLNEKNMIDTQSIITDIISIAEAAFVTYFAFA